MYATHKSLHIELLILCQVLFIRAITFGPDIDLFVKLGKSLTEFNGLVRTHCSIKALEGLRSIYFNLYTSHTKLVPEYLSTHGL